MKNLVFCIIPSTQYKDNGCCGREPVKRAKRTTQEKLAFIESIKDYKSISAAAKAQGVLVATATQWVRKYREALHA